MEIIRIIGFVCGLINIVLSFAVFDYKTISSKVFAALGWASYSILAFSNVVGI